jgi:hypothetical protein
LDRTAELHRLLGEYRKLGQEMARLEFVKKPPPGGWDRQFSLISKLLPLWIVP